jgi:hypothetical protein
MACDKGRILQSECSRALLEQVAAEGILGDPIVGDFEKHKSHVDAMRARCAALWTARTDHIAQCAQ